MNDVPTTAGGWALLVLQAVAFTAFLLIALPWVIVLLAP